MSGSLNPYEKEEWTTLPEGVMRPGGFALTGKLLRMAKLRPPAEILDLGCGTGGSAGKLQKQGYRVTGLDRSQSLLARARETCPELKLVRGDAAGLEFSDASFDGFLAECVLSCVEDPGAVLSECGRVLRPGGVLMLSDLCLRAAEAGAAEAGTLRGPEQWEDLLEEYGFALVAITDETAALTEFVLQFLWNGGSLESLCAVAGAYLRRGDKIGYFSLAARKRN